MKEPFKVKFKTENSSSSNGTGKPEDQFVFMVPDYDPSVLGDMERQIVRTNSWNSSTLICTQFHIFGISTDFAIFVSVSPFTSILNFARFKLSHLSILQSAFFAGFFVKKNAAIILENQGS